LTDSPETDRMPAWSPDGANIAWVVGEGVEREIWRMPAGGGDAVQLTDNEDADVHPSWSPDGSRITFTSDRILDPLSPVISVSNIWTMNADGTDEVPETDHPDAVFVGGNVSWERINRPPTASVAFQPIARTVGDVATFAVAAADSDGTTAAPQWDLDGDGEFDDATGVAANLQLTEDREYTVRVRVVDDEGAVAFASSAIRPTPVVTPPVVDPVPLPRLEILGVRASSNALPRALRRGLALRVAAAGAVRATVTARLLAPLGRRLGLRGTVGSGRATLTGAGSQRIVLRFSPRARRLLAQRSRVTLIVTVRAIDGDGDVVRLTKRVTLRR
jgi:dipeptidyl aminopeptidase/acylaminoacyl peptidase